MDGQPEAHAGEGVVGPPSATPGGIATIPELDLVEPLLFRSRGHLGDAARMYGGEVAAQMMLAAGATVDPERALHSWSGHFLVPGDTSAPVLYRVGLAKDGRSFSTRTVEARQAARTIAVATASFHVPEDGLEHQAASPRAIAADDLPPMAELLSEDPRTLAWLLGVTSRLPVEVRFQQPLDGPGSIDTRARLSVWMRMRPPIASDARAHEAGMTYLSDLAMMTAGLKPHPHRVDDVHMHVATISHSVYLHSPARVDEWLLYELDSDWSGSARCLSHGRVYDTAGVLCASTVQEGLIRMMG